MQLTDLQKRLSDIQSRSERTGKALPSLFLTPAEVLENRDYYPSAVFTGGYEEAERRIAVFLPEWMEEEDLDASEFISCVRIKSFFGVPNHRDYLGSILALGISRDRIGDIIPDGEFAYVFCLPSVVETIVSELDRAGRVTVKAEEVPLSSLPAYKKQVKKITFTVKSLRLDAVAADMFCISRTTAAEAIKEGLVSLNYRVCEKCNAEVKENDVISIRGRGKGRVAETGGKSRRDRLFVTAEIYV